MNALSLHPGMTLLQPMQSGRLALRQVVDVDRVATAAGERVVAAVAEGVLRYRVDYPPAYPVTVLPAGTLHVEWHATERWAQTPSGYVCLRSAACLARPPYVTTRALQVHFERHLSGQVSAEPVARPAADPTSPRAQYLLAAASRGAVYRTATGRDMGPHPLDGRVTQCVRAVREAAGAGWLRLDDERVWRLTPAGREVLTTMRAETAGSRR